MRCACMYVQMRAAHNLLFQIVHLRVQCHDKALTQAYFGLALSQLTLIGLQLVRQLVLGLLRALPLAEQLTVPPLKLGQLCLGCTRC